MCMWCCYGASLVTNTSCSCSCSLDDNDNEGGSLVCRVFVIVIETGGYFNNGIIFI